MYTLNRTAPDRVVAPELDESQQAVVDHPGGPLLVLAGPGTGKTTTLVESVVDRVERRGLTPDQILVLTFSRKAAADLRQRIAGRLGRSVVTPMVLTFHAFCYALVRRFSEFGTGGAPMRLLTAPEQEFRLREMLAGSRDTGRAGWPDSVAAAFGTRAFAGEVRAVLAKARQLGMDPDDVVAAGEAAERPEWQAIGEFFDEYLDVLDAEQVLDYAELVHRSRILLADAAIAAQLRSEIAAVFVDEYQDTDPAQVRLAADHRRPGPRRGGRRRSRSVGLRVPRRGGAWPARLPRALSDRHPGRPRRSSPWPRRDASDPPCWRRAATSPTG